MTALELRACLDALPPDIRREFDEIREIGRGPFGRAQTQQIVDDHLALLLRLRREYHATHADMVEVLGLYGITGPDGAALTAATLSSAISRARARADVRSRGSKRRAQIALPARTAAPSSVSRLHRRHADVGDPKPDLVFASQSAPPRTVAPNDIDLVFGTQVSSSGHEAPEVRRSDHKTRLIDFLARASMED
ncbi:hypothetical protein Nham_3756 [Nitrobacter hamburgensis X14]|uniref:Uncharacterized protein n=1 Tax=Nitrobacter hamburgensis (strain DSM 10229 / NCIMB 13809 / X14) TaxID=323097 RepID=Q1QH17_NITHX|nr:hypothetical protein [Nitrobacter hamburgensis]ABE64480.1 hypothetical protein Nham_3756 [Nitrobacter hamburgensis X14]